MARSRRSAARHSYGASALPSSSASPWALVMGWRRRVEYSLDPFLTALYASPLVALAPLFIIVFGVGVLGKAALVFCWRFFLSSSTHSPG